MIKRAIILPYKEGFSKDNSGAASIFVKESLNKQNLKDFIIYGSDASVDDKYKNIYISAKKKNKFLRNYFYIKEFIILFKKNKFDTIEIHNRPEYVRYLRKSFPKSRIIFYYHNDPNSLRSSKSINDKIYLYKNCKVLFLSKWIEKRFYENLSVKKVKDSVIYPGINKTSLNFNKKKNIILFVGKLNHSKGYDIFCNATKKIKENKKFQNWEIVSCGVESRRSIPVYSHIKELGQLSNAKIIDLYKKSKIAVAPSVWNEPLGRLPIEATANGCFSISSDRGGLAESNKHGLKIKNINTEKLYNELYTLCSNKNYLLKSIKISLKRFDFQKSKFTEKINEIRSDVKKIKKIFLIANLNYKNKKKLFYSFFNKLKFHLKNSTYKTYFLSDRDEIRSSRNILDFTGTINFNHKIINIIKKNNPDLIILGHTDRIFLSTYKKIIEINPSIKIVKIYIDSIAKEFFNFKKVFYDYKFLDTAFISSNPKILSKFDYHKKIYFIPYIVDKKIDYLKSFKNNKKKYDLFFAISHGQNRMVLKKGKKDERETFIMKLKNNLKSVNFYVAGMNGVQPLWGRNFYNYLYNSKIAINLSRGSYKSLYSSDRIASLMGNGLCVINEKVNNYSIFFNKNELLNFKNVNDLSNKIIKLLDNDKIRTKIAKNGYNKFHKLFSTKNVLNYILGKVFFPNKIFINFDKIINKKINI